MSQIGQEMAVEFDNTHTQKKIFAFIICIEVHLYLKRLKDQNVEKELVTKKVLAKLKVISVTFLPVVFVFKNLKFFNKYGLQTKIKDS